MAKKKSHTSLALMVVGALLFLFGGGLDLTVVGLPEGLTVNIIGILLILTGAGVSLT